MKKIVSSRALIVLLIALIFFVLLLSKFDQKNEAAKLTISLPAQAPLSSQHVLVEQALQSPDMVLPKSDVVVSNSQAQILPVEGAPLPVAWDSAPAVDVVVAQLSPALQRSMHVSESLSHSDYSDPYSALNRQRITELREIRQQRLVEGAYITPDHIEDPRLWLEAQQKEAAR